MKAGTSPTAQLESERAAIEAQVTGTYTTCKRCYEDCVSMLSDFRPGGFEPLKLDQLASQGLPRCIQTVFEWMMHHLRVLNAKCHQRETERQKLEKELSESKSRRVSEDIAYRRVQSELFEAQSQVVGMNQEIEDQRAHYAKTWGELTQTRKKMQKIEAEKVPV